MAEYEGARQVLMAQRKKFAREDRPEAKTLDIKGAQDMFVVIGDTACRGPRDRCLQMALVHSSAPLAGARFSDGEAGCSSRRCPSTRRRSRLCKG